MKILIEDKKLLYSKNKVRSINDEIDRIIHLLYEIKSIVGNKEQCKKLILARIILNSLIDDLRKNY